MLAYTVMALATVGLGRRRYQHGFIGGNFLYPVATGQRVRERELSV